MQVFSCDVNEELVIGDDIFVRVLSVQDNCVRLGITALNREPAYWEQTLYCDEAENSYELQAH